MNMQQYKFSKHIVAAILAGGKNKRMGGIDKSFITIENIPIIQRTIDTLKEIFKEIIIVTNSPQDYASYKKDCSIVTDRVRNIGSLGGIFTALRQTERDAVFFVACDMPFLHNGLILRQLAYFKERDCDVLVPRIDGFVEPLHAIYKKNLKEHISCFIREKNSYSIRSFLETVNACYWDLEDNFSHRNIFRNLNTIDDVSKIKGTLCK